MTRKTISALCALLIGGSVLLSLGFKGTEEDTIEALRHIIIMAKGEKMVELHTVHGSFATGVPEGILVQEDLVHLKSDKGDTYVILSNVEAITVHSKQP